MNVLNSVYEYPHLHEDRGQYVGRRSLFPHGIVYNLAGVRHTYAVPLCL